MDDATLNDRFAAIEAQIHQQFQRFNDRMEQVRFNMDQRFDRLDQHLATIDGCCGRLEDLITAVASKMAARVERLDPFFSQVQQ